MIVVDCVEALPMPGERRRQDIQDGPPGVAAFRAAFEDCAVLHRVEARPAPHPESVGERVRIAFWNAERLKYAAPSAALLRSVDAPVVLLAETDVGMARSGNRHTIRDLAADVGAGYVFGVEFVELGLGDARERSWHAGASNADGLHGGGIVSRLPLHRPALVRLETWGRWFDGTFGERRVGGRIAVMAEIAVAGRPVLVVSVHYESHTDPQDRLDQTRVLIEAVDRHADGAPVLIGGDFNTSTTRHGEKRGPEELARALVEDPLRLLRPMPYEPMFDLFAAHGYDWQRCNDEAPTQRTRPDGTPRPPFGRIDWFFSRDLDCRDPRTVPAVDAAGIAISDHDMLVIDIRARTS